jgi:uncharacterized membrane protein (UPF0127 family)
MMGNLINKFLILFLVFWTCAFASVSLPRELLLPNGNLVKLRLAIDPLTQERGLSGVKAKDFAINEGMLFYYPKRSTRQFWMPDTYMALTIIFLDEELTIVHMENMSAQPGEKNPRNIKRTPAIIAQHVLELRADSPMARSLKIGDQLKFKSSH